MTDEVVESRVVSRARLKAVVFGQDALSDLSDAGFKVHPSSVAKLYRDMIIPLTKQVQVRYLFHRVGQAPPEDHEWPSSLLAFQDNIHPEFNRSAASKWM